MMSSEQPNFRAVYDKAQIFESHNYMHNDRFSMQLKLLKLACKISRKISLANILPLQLVELDITSKGSFYS